MTAKTSFPAPTGKAISSADSRASLAGLVVRTTAGVPRAGVLPRHPNALATSRASMGVDVASFEAVLVRNGLPSFAANDGTVTVPVGSPPVANKRIDVVYYKQNESESPFSDGNNNEVFGFVSGAPSPTPSEAAAIALVPAGGIPICSVEIPSTASTTQSAGVVINQIFPYTALTGSPIWARTKAELDLITGFAPGQLGLVLANGGIYRYSGVTNGWRATSMAVELQTDTTNSSIGAIIQAGYGKITGNNTNDIFEDITFPIPFAGRPVISSSFIGFTTTVGTFDLAALAATDFTRVIANPLRPTTTGFRVGLYRPDAALGNANDYYYSWIAIGQLA